MKSKRIINIVFYNFFENGKEERKACLFYRDGSVTQVEYEDGITACEELAQERNITSKAAFKEMVNKEIVHVMSGEDFKNNFDKFVNHEVIDREIINEVVEEAMPKVEVKETEKVKAKTMDETFRKPTEEDLNKKSDKEEDEFINGPKTTETKEEKVEVKAKTMDETFRKPTEEDLNKKSDKVEEAEIKKEEKTAVKVEVEKEEKPKTNKNNMASRLKRASEEEKTAVKVEVADEEELEDEDGLVFLNTSEKTKPEVKSEEPKVEEKVDTAKEVNEFENDYEDEYDDSFDAEIEDTSVKEETDKKEEKKTSWLKSKATGVKNFFARGIKGKVVGLAILAGLGGTGYNISKKAINGVMNKTAITSSVDDVQAAGDYKVELKPSSMINGIPTTFKSTGDTLKTGNNDDYNDYTYEELLEVTDNQTQKTAMTNLGTTIFEFNGSFADAYVEEDKDVRAALKVEEVEALQVAYNDYSKDELKAIFNGTEVRADKMSMDYKSASLQLMGAYVIETSENPVNMSYLLETEEGKEFYNKYHTMYLEAKEATGQDQLDKVKAFYDEVKKDFPITQEIRTEGIAHADAYDTLEAYKLSVTPMIAAAEMQFQNLAVDYTLNDSEIDFINDIGLCNYADDTFERLETITLSSDEDKTNPTELQYRNSIIKVLEAKKQYVIDDEHRELTKLDRFQDAVNGHFEYVETGSYKGTGYTTDTNKEYQYEETKEWEETTKTDEYTTTTKEEKEIPASEKNKIDEEIEKENTDAKADAEAKAEETRKSLQDEEDAKAAKIKEEIEAEEKDMNDKIDKANETINNNNKDTDKSNDTKVKESDFEDHNVDFDDSHSNSNGELDDSVKNITTDGTNADKDLPDPNETGAEFDKNQPAYTSTSNVKSYTVVETEEDEEETTTEDTTESDSVIVQTSETTSTEYPAGTKFYDADGNVYDTYDEMVEAYLNSLTNTATETDAKKYTK